MKNVNLQQAKLSLPILASLAIAIFVIFALIIPKISNIHKIVAETRDNRIKTTEIASEIKSYKQSYQELERIKRDNNQQVPVIFPAREQMAILVETLENATARSGVGHILLITDDIEENSKTTKPVERAPLFNLGGVGEVPFTLEVSGNYRQLVDFLTYLENSPYILEVTRISANANSVQISDSNDLLNTGTAGVKIEGLFFIEK